MTDSFKARTTLNVGAQQYEICGLGALKAHHVDRLPFSLKILLENLLRFEDGVNVRRSDIEALLRWDPQGARRTMKSPLRRRASSCRTSPACRASSISRPCGRRSCGSAAIPQRVNPLAPAELVIDHSVQVDEYGAANSLRAQ